MKFVKQTNDYNCGPTAIYNLLLYFNSVNESNTFRQITKYCSPEPEFGTGFAKFNNGLRNSINKTNVKLYDLKIQPEYKDSIKFLDKGVIILNYHWTDHKYSGRHYIFIAKDNKGIYTVNYTPDQPVKIYLPERELKSLFIKYLFDEELKNFEYQDQIYPKAWFFKN